MGWHCAVCCIELRGEVYGIEFDKRAAELCRRNISLNNFKAKIINSDIASSIKDLKIIII